jgi:hypothetical protein
VLAPDGTIVNELPAQIEPLFAETIGEAFITTEDVTGELTQPGEVDPNTVYVVLAVGVTTADPPCIVYEEAPLGEIVKDFPAQIEPLLTTTVGIATL